MNRVDESLISVVVIRRTSHRSVFLPVQQSNAWPYEYGIVTIQDLAS